MLPEHPTGITFDALDKSSPALANSAVAHCCKAWKKAYRAERAETDIESFAARKGAEAFRAALPPLTTRESCRDFIACVAQGMLLGAIAEKNGGKLLYAAQIALSNVPKEEKPRDPSILRGKLIDFEPDWEPKQ